MDELDRAQDAAEIYEKAAMQSHFNKKKMEQLRDINADAKRDCINCEKPIPRARLKANPEAIRCIGCQKIHEQEGVT